jgi:metal-responsive CopG/Arc/MetJ family transcriptional regulator
MKVGVSIPDDIFQEGEVLARNLKLSRSRIYSRALLEFVTRNNPDTLTSAINNALLAADDEDADFAKEASRRNFSQTEW